MTLHLKWADGVSPENRLRWERMGRMWAEGKNTQEIAKAMLLQEHEVYRELTMVKRVATLFKPGGM